MIDTLLCRSFVSSLLRCLVRVLAGWLLFNKRVCLHLRCHLKMLNWVYRYRLAFFRRFSQSLSRFIEILQQSRLHMRTLIRVITILVQYALGDHSACVSI